MTEKKKEKKIFRTKSDDLLKDRFMLAAAIRPLKKNDRTQKVMD